MSVGVLAAVLILGLAVLAVAVYLICRRRNRAGLNIESMSAFELYEEGYTVKFGSEELGSAETDDLPRKAWVPTRKRLFTVAGDSEALSDLL
jgi:hypothetical protein